MIRGWRAVLVLVVFVASIVLALAGAYGLAMWGVGVLFAFAIDQFIRDEEARRGRR